MADPQTWTLFDWYSKFPAEYIYKIAAGLLAMAIGIFSVGFWIGTRKKARDIHKLENEISILKNIPRITINAPQESNDISRYGHYLKYSFMGEIYIHPGIVEQLEGWLYDSLPVAAAIDVEGAMKSNDFGSEVEVIDRNGRKIVYSEKKHDDLPSESYSYEYIGTSASGVHVLKTCTCGGGSGKFYSVLFLVFQADQIVSYTKQDPSHRNRIILKCLGSMALGDRYDGNVVMSGNKLTIGKRVIRWPEELSEDVVLTIE